MDGKISAKIKHLYELGRTDAEISRELDVYPSTAFSWRKRNNLPVNKKITVRGCQALYERGLVDNDIGRAIGVDGSAVAAWRKRNNLPSNRPRFGGCAANNRKSLEILWSEMEELYYVRMGDEQIARKMLIHPSVVQEWRRIMNLPEKWSGDMKDPESLYCDSDFLKKILGKEGII